MCARVHARVHNIIESNGFSNLPQSLGRNLQHATRKLARRREHSRLNVLGMRSERTRRLNRICFIEIFAPSRYHFQSRYSCGRIEHFI